MKVDYNAPVVLTFATSAVIVFLLDTFLYRNFSRDFFMARPFFALRNPLDWFRLVSHVLGHADINHLFNNLVMVLLLGPILEEKYGSANVFSMMLITALVTGIINAAFFSTGLMGASGIVFMFIIMASIVNVKRGSVPLSFILVLLIFIGREVFQIFREDNISQAGHIIGGVMGALSGFHFAKPGRKSRKSPQNIFG